MARLHTMRKKGSLNLPGITHETKSLTEKLLLQDAEKHHCYFRPAGLHNHLSHQVLAAYDMGAAPGLIQRIYDKVASYQRPIFVEEKDAKIVVTKDNWTQHLGDPEAYGAYFKFFSQEVEKLGVSSALETYVFRPEANYEGKWMLNRFVTGALHPLIQTGYGAEFGNDILIATGLAQTAIHKAGTADIFPYSEMWADNASPPPPNEGAGRQPTYGPSLLEIVRQVCDSPVLAPPLPYDPNVLLSERLKKSVEGPKAAEIMRICKQYMHSIPNDASDEELSARVEELIWTGSLVLFATGREGRETRLDFFLMHLVTSSLFFEPLLGALEDTRSKVALIRQYIPIMVTLILSRGRPVIRPSLVREWSTTPRPSGWQAALGIRSHKGSGIGDMAKDEDYNPWPALIQGAAHHPDLHLAKTMRTLVLAERKYGIIPPGGVIGAFRPAKKGVDQPEETFPGMAKIDGTLFVKAAGVMMDYMGWSVCGEPAKEDWDRSALGWDDAWVNRN
ncbi:hypothetical protein P691DRAFT_761515 [Macrolepiota fuliginosa MF-IS2]|uniref:Oxidoreductase AflY n=1 Tax=Macrolepiota fuliginosa MF-IS2 TaxID=1400762 RepID=A0A9P5XBJ1_9AGAR|nr:hypothetical protein P691DRAFT_761515 [Macrolepiota fuliginosa MF-IS2]